MEATRRRTTIVAWAALLAVLLASASAVASPENRVRAKIDSASFSQPAAASQPLDPHQACGAIVYDLAAESLVAPKKALTPRLKQSPHGPKIADVVPQKGVPTNWSQAEIKDAIVDYQTSIASRKAELQAFDLAGKGSEVERLAHARRITEEESFLKSLEHALGNRR